MSLLAASAVRRRVFLPGQAVSMLGNGLASLAIPLLVLQRTHSTVAAVLASLPASAGYVAVGLPAGVTVDRLDPWRVMIAADIVRAAVFLGLFALTAFSAGTLWLTLALAFAAGGAAVYFDTALAIVVRDLFGGRQLVAANAWLETANQVGLVVGPAIAGLLAAAGLLQVAMLADALTFCASLASITVLRGQYRPVRRAGRPAAGRAGLGADLAAGIRYLTATRLLCTLLLLVLVVNLALGADKLMVFLAKDTLALSAAQVGLIASAGGVGGVLGAAATGLLCRWLGPVAAFAVGAALSGIGLALMAVSAGWVLLMAANALYCWAIIAASVTSRTLRQALVPRELLGRVTAAWRLGGQAVTLAGGLAAGALAGMFGGPRPVLAGAAVLTVVAVAVGWAASIRKDAIPVAVLSAAGE